MIFTSTKRKNSAIKKNGGFSLFEVLIALSLTAIMLGAVIGGTFTDSQKLDDTLQKIENAVRFSSDEATLRNKIIRIHFNLDKSPQHYSVEYGPSDSFVLPAFVAEEEEDLSLDETKERAKEKEKLNQRFNKVQEFEEENLELSEDIKIIAIGTDLHKKLILDGASSIYVYPTGEKDGAVIILGTSEEVVALKISPFTTDIEKEYITLDNILTDELDEKQIEVAKKLFEKWLKE